MVDDRASPAPLGGTWEGFYDYDNKAYSSKNFPITAAIEQDGRSLRGTMIDGVTEIRRDYRTVVEACEGRMSASDEERARRLLEEHPDALIEVSLPEESRLVGKVAGDVVRFTKTYLGEYTTHGTFGGRRSLFLRIARHRVHYEGTLAPRAGTIEGRWIIRPPGILGRFLPPLNAGGFRLLKAS